MRLAGASWFHYGFFAGWRARVYNNAYSRRVLYATARRWQQKQSICRGNSSLGAYTRCPDGDDCGGGEKSIVKGHVKSPPAILLDGFLFLSDSISRILLLAPRWPVHSGGAPRPYGGKKPLFYTVQKRMEVGLGQSVRACVYASARNRREEKLFRCSGLNAIICTYIRPICTYNNRGAH